MHETKFHLVFQMSSGAKVVQLLYRISTGIGTEYRAYHEALLLSPADRRSGTDVRPPADPQNVRSRRNFAACAERRCGLSNSFELLDNVRNGLQDSLIATRFQTCGDIEVCSRGFSY